MSDQPAADVLVMGAGTIGCFIGGSLAAAGVTSDTMGKVKAGELVNFVAQQVGGKGGGKADMAMAGGSDATGVPSGSTAASSAAASLVAPLLTVSNTSAGRLATGPCSERRSASGATW